MRLRAACNAGHSSKVRIPIPHSLVRQKTDVVRGSNALVNEMPVFGVEIQVWNAYTVSLWQEKYRESENDHNKLETKQCQTLNQNLGRLADHRTE